MREIEGSRVIDVRTISVCALLRHTLCTASGRGARLGAMAHAPQLPMAALHEHVLHLLQRNDLAAAHAACRRLNTEHPDYAVGWRTASLIAHRLGDPAGALASIDRSLPSGPVWKSASSAYRNRSSQTA